MHQIIKGRITKRYFRKLCFPIEGLRLDFSEKEEGINSNVFKRLN